MTTKLISGDCHIIEPPSTWTERMPAGFEERAPRVERIAASEDLSKGGGEVDWWTIDGQPLLPCFALAPGLRVQMGGARDLPMEATVGAMGGGIGTDDYSAADYVADLARDDTDGAVLYPTTGLFFYSLQDRSLVQAIFSAYNDYAAEFCADAPDRLKAAALLTVHDPAAAVAEMRRARELGLATAMLPVEPPAGTTYGDAVYEDLWAAASDLDMPITFHVGTNQIASQKAITQTTFVTFDNYIRTAISDLIFSGAFTRHDNLKVIAAEFELGWIPFFLDRLDYTYTQRRRREGWLDLPSGVNPSDYWRTNCFVSFQEDPTVAPEHWDVIGVDNIMIGTDFPHTESTYPNSLATSEKVLSALSDDDRAKVFSENAQRLFGFGA